MKTVTSHIRSRLLGPVEYAEALGNAPDIRDIEKCNWFPKAIAYAKRRMIVGFFRYGNFHDYRQPKYDRIGSAIHRLKTYQRTGNTEYVIDAFNLCGIEFERPNHPRAHFKAIDDGPHTPITKD